MKVKLSAVLEAIELQTNETDYYFCTETGEVIMITLEQMNIAERGDSLERYPEWLQEQVQLAEKVLENEDLFIPLPSRYEVNEYEIMESFALSIESQRVSDIIYDALRGKGAFRRFKDLVERHNLIDQWYQYRDNAYGKIAIDWCQSHGLDYDA